MRVSSGSVKAGRDANFLFAEKTVADPRGDPPAPPCPLFGTRLGDGLDGQLLQLRPIAVAADPCETRIDHVADIGNGDAGFRDVGGQDDPLSATGLEHPALFALGQRA